MSLDKNNNETDVRQLGCEGMEWIKLAKDTIQWWGFMRAEINHEGLQTRGSYNCGIFLKIILITAHVHMPTCMSSHTNAQTHTHTHTHTNHLIAKYDSYPSPVFNFTCFEL